VLSRCLSLWPQSFLLGCAEGSACSLVFLSRQQKEEEEEEEETHPVKEKMTDHDYRVEGKNDERWKGNIHSRRGRPGQGSGHRLHGGITRVFLPAR